MFKTYWIIGLVVCVTFAIAGVTLFFLDPIHITTTTEEDSPSETTVNNNSLEPSYTTYDTIIGAGKRTAAPTVNQTIRLTGKTAFDGSVRYTLGLKDLVHNNLLPLNPTPINKKSFDVDVTTSRLNGSILANDLDNAAHPQVFLYNEDDPETAFLFYTTGNQEVKHYLFITKTTTTILSGLSSNVQGIHYTLTGNTHYLFIATTSEILRYSGTSTTTFSNPISIFTASTAISYFWMCNQDNGLHCVIWDGTLSNTLKTASSITDNLTSSETATYVGPYCAATIDRFSLSLGDDYFAGAFVQRVSTRWEMTFFKQDGTTTSQLINFGGAPTPLSICFIQSTLGYRTLLSGTDAIYYSYWAAATPTLVRFETAFSLVTASTPRLLCYNSEDNLQHIYTYVDTSDTGIVYKTGDSIGYDVVTTDSFHYNNQPIDNFLFVGDKHSIILYRSGTNLMVDLPYPYIYGTMYGVPLRQQNVTLLEVDLAHWYLIGAAIVVWITSIVIAIISKQTRNIWIAALCGPVVFYTSYSDE